LCVALPAFAVGFIPCFGTASHVVQQRDRTAGEQWPKNASEPIGVEKRRLHGDKSAQTNLARVGKFRQIENPGR
jgi:hypothetical protein